MVREIHRLQKENESLGEQNDSLGARNQWIEQIMRSLKNDDRGTEIIQRLRRGESHRSIVEWLGRPMTKSPPDHSPMSDLQLGQEMEDYRRRLIINHDPRYWINVTSDASLINHLISLYMTWIHPTHMLIDETNFLVSFRDCLDTHCSGSLVNAMCALSCHLLHNGWDDDEETKVGIDSLCLQFMDEARLLIKTADPLSMTTCQTYAIMFLVELGSGNGQAATSHLRLAVEILTTRQPDFEETPYSESDEMVAWGILSLHAWVIDSLPSFRQSIQLTGTQRVVRTHLSKTFGAHVGGHLRLSKRFVGPIGCPLVLLPATGGCGDDQPAQSGARHRV